MNTLTMKWLLRREYWEHKGAMFWAPAIVAALLVIFVGGVLVYGLASHGMPGHVTINGQTIEPGELRAAMPLETRQMLAKVASGMYVIAGAPLLVIMAGVVFFYCIGALYNERQDRSILFWKSLPVSDGMTVLSKALTALCVAPLISIGLAVATSLAMLLLGAIGIAISGMNLVGTLFLQPDLYLQPLRLLALLPVYVVWALPTVGWLLLVSCWAKTKPLLWAVGIPLIGLLLLKWISYTLENFAGAQLDIMPVAQHVVNRLLGSVMPGAWFMFTGGVPSGMHQNAQGPDMQVAFDASWMTLGTLDAVLGALLGAAMIFGAIRLRRWRDEG